MSDQQFKLVQQTTAHNLAAWKDSGVVKTLKYYSAEDADVCATCRAHHGAILNISDSEIAGRDRGTARATLGNGLAVSAFPLYVPV